MAPPLDKKYLTPANSHGGKMEKIPALHPAWKSEVNFVEYKAPPVDPKDRAGREEWQERMGFIEEDLDWLLKLPHDKFWCQVVFDATLQGCIDSYLRAAPRSHDIVYDLPPGLKQSQDKIHKMMFMVCLRMATHKESKESYITPEVFGEILYENFIFDVPKLMDLCVLYGKENGPLLTKMIENIFNNQPAYWDDLSKVVPVILRIFSDILAKTGFENAQSSTPQKLTDPTKPPLLSTIPLPQFQDFLFYFCDISNTLQCFLEVYPIAGKVFKSDDFASKLGTLYESLTAAFKEAFRSRDWSEVHVKPLLMQTFHRAQVSMLNVFRRVAFNNYLQPLLELSNQEEVGKHIEDYLELLSSLLAERRFLAHHEHLFPFSEDIDLMTQTSYTVDETRLQFILEGIQEACFLHGRGTVVQTQDPLAKQYTADDMATTCAIGAENTFTMSEDGGACAGPKLSGIQLESMITNIKDLFPDLGEGFIELCLEEYNYNLENVINGILEDKLLEPLQGLDRTMPREVKPLEVEEEVGILDKRSNIYDHDEFDIFHRDNIDTSKIHQGKMEKVGDQVSVLDDKRDMENVRDLYKKYGSEDVESMYDKHNDMYEEVYEDEYDDTYDTNQIGATDADSADELLAKRILQVPRIFGGASASPAVDSESSEDENSSSDRRNRDEFIQDPAILRQKQEERRASKAANRNRNRQGQNQGQGQKVYDVKGNPKGQGQASETVRNRAFKEKNKSTRVHHNRRVLADKKRQF